MEKAVVFGPLVLFFGFFLLLIILFIGFIVKLISKSKNEDWTGQVIDKKVNEVEDFDTGSKSDHYFLVVKIEGSRNRNVGLSREKWEAFSVGDKIHKPKGKLFPEKI
jgi:hypothetical protein